MTRDQVLKALDDMGAYLAPSHAGSKAMVIWYPGGYPVRLAGHVERNRDWLVRELAGGDPPPRHDALTQVGAVYAGIEGRVG